LVTTSCFRTSTDDVHSILPSKVYNGFRECLGATCPAVEERNPKLRPAVRQNEARNSASATKIKHPSARGHRSLNDLKEEPRLINV